MPRLDELLRQSAGRPPNSPNIREIERLGRRRLWIGRLMTGTLSIGLLFGAAFLLTNNFDEGDRDSSVPASPVGEGILFTASAKGDYESAVYVMDPQTEEYSQIYDEESGAGGGEQRPKWSPDGTRIAMAINTVPGDPATVDTNMEVVVMNSDGTGLERLTHSPGLDVMPTWSPDGSQIAFFSGLGSIKEFDESGQGPDGIWVMGSDGSDLHKITEGDGRADLPSWSPDGTKIAYDQMLPGGHSEIFVMDPDGSNAVRLTNHSYGVAEPVWSPQGDRIAFIGQRESFYEDVFVADSSGGEVERVASIDSRGLTSLAWSPDGSEIAISTFNDQTETSQISIIDVSTGEIHEVGPEFYRISGIDWR